MRRSHLPWLLLALACSATAASPDPVSRDTPPLRVLFVGNSYTYVNDLPAMFARLAEAGGFSVETAMAAAPGWTLADHAASGQTLQAIRGTRWQYVVLQEQSAVPVIERERVERMYPAVRSLVREIAGVGAAPLLFMTWGHRDGLPGTGCENFGAMQRTLSEAYTRIAGELGIGVVAVGNVWREARVRDPRIGLWQSDGSHPTVQGSYLAACVFYATIFKRSPEGLTYAACLPADQVSVLQSLAANVLLKGRAR
jgi:hypothetical protein